MPRDTTRSRRERAVPLALQLTSFVIVLGVPDGIIGVLWPSIGRDLHLALADLGPLVLCGTVLYVVGGLVADRVRVAFNLGNTMVGICLLAVASFAIWAAAPDWSILLLGVGVLGLSKGLLDAVVNAEAALDGGMRRLGLVHATWAVGGTLGPLMVAAVLATSGDWRVAVIATGAACAVVVLPLALLDRRRESVVPATPKRRAKVAAGTVDGPSAARRQPASHVRRLVVATVIAFAIYVAAETGPVSWGYTYLIGDRRLTHGAAAVAVASFWATLMAGRFALAVAGERAPARRLLNVSSVLLVAGTAMIWLLPGASSVAGFPVAGLGAAAFFPLLVGLTPEWIGTDLTGHTVGLAIAASAAGGPIAVSILGVLAEHLGLRSLAPSMLVAACLLFVVNQGLMRLTSHHPAIP